MGYSSCSSCHASPTGGQVLTAYGREISNEISTWETGLESPLPPWLLLGGDIRYLRMQDKDLERKFLMQADASLGFDTKWAGAVVTAGTYGGDSIQKMRTAYLKLKPDESASIRIGKFLPHYGIQFADHTVYTRRPLGFDQGDENYSVDLTLVGKVGELSVSVFRQQEDDVFNKYDDDYQVTDKGSSLRGALFLGKRHQVGFSALRRRLELSETSMINAFGLFGWTENFYQTIEVNNVWSRISKKGKWRHACIASYNEFGYEFVKGVHLKSGQGIIRGEDNMTRADLTLQWFPYPGWDLLLQSTTEEINRESYYPVKFIIHYYF